MRLLVAEDDQALRSVLVRGLERSGYFVDAVATGDEALDYIRFYEYAVVILDWRMPRTSGLEVVTRMRQEGNGTAILMLTARDTPADRVAGLDAGADDYLVKPFDFDELLARVRALARRPGSTDGRVLKRGALALDPATRDVLAGDFPLQLTGTEFRILEVLMFRAPAVVNRQVIAQHAWKDETEPIGSNTIDVQIARLRAKLAGSGAQIVTVRGAGYRLAS
jgi:two-component system, OmpR family, copper resistance phosphate regulon response regulator CusR